MTRRELITSDDYIIASLECIVVSKKGVFEMRKELTEWMIKLKNELLESPSGSVIEAAKELIEHLQKQINSSDKNADPDSWSWGLEEGCIISVNHAKTLLSLIAGSNYSPNASKVEEDQEGLWCDVRGDMILGNTNEYFVQKYIIKKR